MSSAGENQPKTPEQGDSNAQTAKSKWQKASTPVKAGIIGGVGVLGLALFCCCPAGGVGIWWNSSGPPNILQGIVGKQPPYAHVAAKLDSQRKPALAALETKHGGLFKIPNGELREMHLKIKQDVQPMLDAINPPPITLDTSCEGLISDITIEKATYVDDTGLIDFPVKYTARKKIERFGTNLKVKSLDSGGAVLDDDLLHQTVDAAPGEKVNGHFSLFSSADKVLAKVSSFKVFYKQK